LTRGGRRCGWATSGTTSPPAHPLVGAAPQSGTRPAGGAAWLQTIADLLKGRADIRYIQQLLGHEKLETTAIYTEVSIAQLKAIHAKSHPAEKRKRIDHGE